MIYITGDTHRDFGRIFDFCEENRTTQDDILIILGDAEINYYLDISDYNLKWQLSALEVTLFCVHGNHEERPFLIDGYKEKTWRGGVVYCEEEFPNLLFAKDGEIYDFDGKKTIVIGGAYSVDKCARICSGAPWFASEQPSDEIKACVERNLEQAGWRVDCVLTHAAPKQYEPTWAFIPGRSRAAVDSTTEEWLDSIERRLNYSVWYCGHYHVDSLDWRVRFMYQDFEELGGMTNLIHGDDFLKSIPLERKLEIDAILKKSKEEFRRNGVKGMMTLEEFEKKWERRLKEYGII